jgi:hypothetical protein
MANNLVSTAAKGLSSIVGDVYKDVAQPSARRVGLSLETLTKVALSPVDMINWGFERAKDWLQAKMDIRLSQTPPECVVRPSDNITHAALAHISLSNDTPELRELYAELLLKAMDSRTSGSVHPAYFHVVEQLAPEEALVLVGLHELHREALFKEEVTPYSSSFGDTRVSSVEEQFTLFCAAALSRTPTQSDIWLINLCRLGVLTLQSVSEAIFREAEHDKDGYRPPNVDNHEHRILTFTAFGKSFISACAPVTAASKKPPDETEPAD